MLPLATCPQLTSIQAGGAGIYGEIPKLTDMEFMVDGEIVSNITFPLAKCLVTFDLSANNVTGMHELPVQRLMLLRENHQLNVDVKVLTQALSKHKFLDLSGTALSNQDEAAELLKEGVMKTTHMHAFRDETAGHACKDVIGTLKVTPSKFLPQELCKCLPGWFGSGATCEMCPSNKFSDDLGFDTCKSCPANSTAPAGSTKMSECKCKFGDLHEGIVLVTRTTPCKRAIALFAPNFTCSARRLEVWHRPPCQTWTTLAWNRALMRHISVSHRLHQIGVLAATSAARATMELFAQAVQKGFGPQEASVSDLELRYSLFDMFASGCFRGHLILESMASS